MIGKLFGNLGERAIDLVCLVATVIIFAAGWAVEGWRKDAEIERIQKDHALAAGAAAHQAVLRLADAQARGNDLQGKLAIAERNLDQLAKEKEIEIRRLTTGRRCLDGAAVRVLNAGASPLPMPAPAAEPVRADAAFATDTDVGVWAGQCRKAYDTCRGRLQAIADYEAGEKQ